MASCSRACTQDAFQAAHVDEVHRQGPSARGVQTLRRVALAQTQQLVSLPDPGPGQGAVEETFGKFSHRRSQLHRAAFDAVRRSGGVSGKLGGIIVGVGGAAHCLKQMLLNFGRTRFPGGSSHEIRDSWTPSSERLAATHRRTRFRHPFSGVLRLIDTRCASHKDHYVNQVADALLKATRISIGGGGLRRDAFGDLVSILHVSADCAEGGII